MTYPVLFYISKQISLSKDMNLLHGIQKENKNYSKMFGKEMNKYIADLLEKEVSVGNAFLRK